MSGLLRTILIAFVLFGILIALFTAAGVELTHECDVPDCREAPGAGDDGFRIAYSFGLLLLVFAASLIAATIMNLIQFKPRTEPEPVVALTSYGRWLTDARQYRGWSTAELARIAGVIESTITDLESGRAQSVDPRLAQRITEALQRG